MTNGDIPIALQFAPSEEELREQRALHDGDVVNNNNNNYQSVYSNFPVRGNGRSRNNINTIVIGERRRAARTDVALFGTGDIPIDPQATITPQSLHVADEIVNNMIQESEDDPPLAPTSQGTQYGSSQSSQGSYGSSQSSYGSSQSSQSSQGSYSSQESYSSQSSYGSPSQRSNSSQSQRSQRTLSTQSVSQRSSQGSQSPMIEEPIYSSQGESQGSMQEQIDLEGATPQQSQTIMIGDLLDFVDLLDLDMETVTSAELDQVQNYFDLLEEGHFTLNDLDIVAEGIGSQDARELFKTNWQGYQDKFGKSRIQRSFNMLTENRKAPANTSSRARVDKIYTNIEVSDVGFTTTQPQYFIAQEYVTKHCFMVESQVDDKRHPPYLVHLFTPVYGQCSCPDFRQRALLSNKITNCKHMFAARLKLDPMEACMIEALGSLYAETKLYESTFLPPDPQNFEGMEPIQTPVAQYGPYMIHQFEYVKLDPTPFIEKRKYIANQDLAVTKPANQWAFPYLASIEQILEMDKGIIGTDKEYFSREQVNQLTPEERLVYDMAKLLVPVAYQRGERNPSLKVMSPIFFMMKEILRFGVGKVFIADRSQLLDILVSFQYKQRIHQAQFDEIRLEVFGFAQDLFESRLEECINNTGTRLEREQRRRTLAEVVEIFIAMEGFQANVNVQDGPNTPTATALLQQDLVIPVNTSTEGLEKTIGSDFSGNPLDVQNPNYLTVSPQEVKIMQEAGSLDGLSLTGDFHLSPQSGSVITQEPVNNNNAYSRNAAAVNNNNAYSRGGPVNNNNSYSQAAQNARIESDNKRLSEITDLAQRPTQDKADTQKITSTLSDFKAENKEIVAILKTPKVTLRKKSVTFIDKPQIRRFNKNPKLLTQVTSPDEEVLTQTSRVDPYQLMSKIESWENPQKLLSLEEPHQVLTQVSPWDKPQKGLVFNRKPFAWFHKMEIDSSALNEVKHLIDNGNIAVGIQGLASNAPEDRIVGSRKFKEIKPVLTDLNKRIDDYYAKIQLYFQEYYKRNGTEQEEKKEHEKIKEKLHRYSIVYNLFIRSIQRMEDAESKLEKMNLTRFETIEQLPLDKKAELLKLLGNSWTFQNTRSAKNGEERIVWSYIKEIQSFVLFITQRRFYVANTALNQVEQKIIVRDMKELLTLLIEFHNDYVRVTNALSKNV